MMDFAYGHLNIQNTASKIHHIKTEKVILSEKPQRHAGNLVSNLVFIFLHGTETMNPMEKEKNMMITI